MISELPVVSVHIPPLLRGLVGGSSEVMGSGETVGEVLEAIGHRYPHWRAKLFQADGALIDGVSVYLGTVCIDGREGLKTPVENVECINVLPAANALLDIGDDLPEPAPHSAAHDISIGD